jgi:hypothetical protein
MAEHAGPPRSPEVASMPVLRAALVLVLPLLAAACAAVTAADGERIAFGSAEFRAYVERVFREQNDVADRLAFALEDTAAADGTEHADLAAAEDRLLAACAGLNELATARRDEQRLGVRRSAGIARQAPECERATRAAREALPAVAN